jgi:DNA-binding MarR family transcriptional regulator
MQTIRAEMRRQRGHDLSVVQLRTLAFLNRNPGAPLSAVAEHVGLTLPSMSSQVSGLVGRNLLNRSTAAHDRRYLTLTLTDQGRAVYEAARRNALEQITSMLDTLSPREQATLIEALTLLAGLFPPRPAATGDPSAPPPAPLLDR